MYKYMYKHMEMIFALCMYNEYINLYLYMYI